MLTNAERQHATAVQTYNIAIQVQCFEHTGYVFCGTLVDTCFNDISQTHVLSERYHVTDHIHPVPAEIPYYEHSHQYLMGVLVALLLLQCVHYWHCNVVE